MIGILKTFIVIFLLIVISGCTTQSEDEAYKNAMEIDSEKERVAALNNFLQNFPESKNKDRALFRLFRDHVALKDEKDAVSTATEYLNLFPEDSRMSKYNSVSWTLAENSIGLDSAKVYADRAVELARGVNERTLTNILDTQAYVYFQAGDASRALSIQEEAMKGHENSAGYLSRLAQYQNGAGHLNKSLETITRSIVLGGGLDSQLKFKKWMNENEVDNKSRKKIVNKVIDELQKNGITSETKSQGAILLALAEIDLKKSEKWAQEAVSSIDENTSLDDQLLFHQNLATVLKANGKNKAALDALIPVKGIASIYDSGYWLNLGNAYAENKMVDEAINAYVDGMLYRISPEIFDAASLLGFTKEIIENKINLKKQELLNFQPGHFEESDSFSGRVVLTELFTGAECPPCKGADLALDLIGEYYPRSMVAILEYHLHIPGTDPLTNKESESRKEYYSVG